MRLERRRQRLLSIREFGRRMATYAALAAGLVVISLTIGTLGYRYFGELSWIDALYNAAMILTGMGPVDHMHATAAKLFASGYALFSAVALLSTIGLLLTPLLHRLLHHFNLEIDDGKDGGDRS